MKKQPTESLPNLTRRRVIGTVAVGPAFLLPGTVAQAVPSAGGANLAPVMITPPKIIVWRAA